ncbi:MAG: hypothetical protein ACW981_02420 [Candidatus Hodarchaeales archaeon]|jgi:hypothetical protein
MQEAELVLSIIIGSFGAVVGLYGAIQSWLTKRKTKQLELELLVTKLDIDLTYDTEVFGDKKILNGKIIFKNLGNTNLRITELDIAGEDRSNKLIESQEDDQQVGSGNNYNLKNILGVSNSHLIKHSLDQKTFILKQSDEVFVLREGRIRILNVRKNISNYISNTLEKINFFFNQEEGNKLFSEFYFKQTLGSDLRGFEIFPGGEKTQEFIIEYENSGIVYVNVETTTLRMLKTDINTYEKMKIWGDSVLNNKEVASTDQKIFTNLAELILTPVSDEFHREKETFLILLK